MIFHDDVYEPYMAHPPRVQGEALRAKVQYGFRCRHCGSSAPCSWQVEHGDDCPHRHREGKSLCSRDEAA